jgi:hypothetical protein
LKQFPDHVEGPISAYFEPVWSDVESVQKRTVKGILAGFLAWQYFFEGIFSGDKDEAGSVLIVIQSCATTSTFVITGTQAKFIDFGDHHDKKYRHMGVSYPFIAGDDKNSAIQVQCAHVVNVYPTAHLESLHRTETPIHYAVIIVSIFSFAAAVFVLYDYFVSSRQHHTEKQADKSNAIVQEMFPGDMAARLFESGGSSPDWTSTKSSKSKNAFGRLERDTIAELHPDATVLCKSRSTGLVRLVNRT